MPNTDKRVTTKTLTAAEWPWQKLLMGLVFLLTVLLLFRDTAQAMIAIWNRSETYAHAFLVLPISAWLVWRRRGHLVGLPLRPASWLLVPIALVCAIWLLGELAAAQVLTQLALVALLVLLVPAVFGMQVGKALMFPLLFMFFAVPAGEAFVPAMMEMTADFTVAAISLSGVPVYREGLQFIIPSGSWSVVEACSGVRYLIASFMVGTLFAYLNYQSMKRRLLFIAFSLLVPIVANWLRAYMIVMIAHLSNNEIATGVDHIVYGWVFFGIIIGLMFFVGSRWSEPDAPLPLSADASDKRAGRPALEAGSLNWGVGVAALLLMGLVQSASWHLNQQVSALPQLELPADVGGVWVADSSSLTPWTPGFKNPGATAAKTYRHGQDRVGVWVGYYRDQRFDNKLITSTNGLAAPVSDPQWVQANQGSRRLNTPAGPVSFRVAEVQAALKAGASQGQKIRAWQVYWIGGHFVAADTPARLQLALNRLLARGDDAAVAIFYTDAVAAGDPDARLEHFVAASIQSVAARLESTRAKR